LRVKTSNPKQNGPLLVQTGREMGCTRVRYRLRPLADSNSAGDIFIMNGNVSQNPAWLSAIEAGYL
jgi:hypothetical protein